MYEHTHRDGLHPGALPLFGTRLYLPVTTAADMGRKPANDVLMVTLLLSKN